ncbi:hypothetical protein DOM21_14095 [Bacteriovorax stolpii]|uniref:Hsp20/alpha crystallin family protein n=1 Tax=Bacteriovorax stolpii TaxID=960 RepID=UPI00115B0579|nr:Hsp20/alpha crystallin family protein [Bacteriovorax stolpii]QDK42560.1 hypothetical protein DOM21_14095 [Bacteriovorax stolpii]BDT27582.1 Hsp20/alpha crystallin family protein [Bacteriovorax sp. HI3]
MRNRALINLLQPNYSPFFFDQIFDETTQSAAYRNFRENEEAYFTTIDMPGVNSSDIAIDMEENIIRVSAERKDAFDKETVVRKYDYIINVPKNVDRDKISAHYENGVLNLALHKTVQDKAKKKITISTGEKPKSWSDFLNFKKHEAVDGQEAKTVN